VTCVDRRQLDRIAAIAAEAEEVDGWAPLDEATWLVLRNHPDRADVLRTENGFAVLVDGVLSAAVRPSARGEGLGVALVEHFVSSDSSERPGETLRAWSHGDHPAAAALARRFGFERVRELWVMRRSAGAGLPEAVVPDEVVVRGYSPADADEVVRVNAAAFAAHPEQGAMDAANLAERMAEPWFDPAGLLVAEDASAPGRLLGFHWTKQHSDSLGEVYVVGIDPAAQGRGLGKLLTLAGLQHLASRGVSEVLLYVESDNRPAIAVYSGLGFTHAGSDTHVMYQRG
jgi:mycothiol synthase